MKHIDINDNDQNFIPTTVLNRLDKMSDDLTGSLLKNLAGRFKDEIADGIKEGLTSKEIGKRLQAKYGDFKNKTTQSIVARTLLHAAYNQGNMFDALQDDMIVAFRFSNPADARSTQICKHLAGKVIKKEDIKDFIPPLHWGCRSTLIPLFYNDDIDPSTVVDKQMRQTDWFKKNVVRKLDKEFTDFTSMDLTKAVEETKGAESDEINVPEEIKRMTNETLDRLSDILDRQTLPFNTSGVADFVARESMLEAAKQILPETPNIRITKDYIRTNGDLRSLYDAYKGGDLYNALLKTNAYDVAKSIDAARKRIFENEAIKAFKADSVDDENITAFLENNHGAARISPQLQEQFKNVLKQFGRDPDFFNITLNDLRRKVTAGLSSYSDFHMLDESAQIAFAEYLTEFFKSIDRGAKVTFKDAAALDETIINTFIRHADYDTFIETAPMALFNGAAFAGIKRHLNEAISAVTSNEFEANEIRNRIVLSGVERIDTRSAAAAVKSVRGKVTENLQKSLSGGIINNEQSYEFIIKLSDEKYNKIRNQSDDIVKISNNTGFDVQVIKEIKEHVFYDEHELSDGKKRFDSDFDMAIAWERMTTGKNIKPSDLILLNHEIYERKLMKEKGLSYYEAHTLANEKYNWEAVLLKENGDEK